MSFLQRANRKVGVTEDWAGDRCWKQDLQSRSFFCFFVFWVGWGRTLITFVGTDFIMESELGAAGRLGRWERGRAVVVQTFTSLRGRQVQWSPLGCFSFFSFYFSPSTHSQFVCQIYSTRTKTECLWNLFLQFHGFATWCFLYVLFEEGRCTKKETLTLKQAEM